jgi:hypothetical protein
MKAALLALLVGCGWTPKQVALGSISTMLLTMDWWQTVGITQQCVELNPIIGPCGERVPVDLYMMGAIVGHLVLAHVVGPDWRPVVLGGVAGAEVATVWANAASE